MKPQTLLVSTLALGLAAAGPLAAQMASLTVDTAHPSAKVSPVLYGLMTEEINYSYDGGLYAEMVRDRAVSQGWGTLDHWTLVTRGNAVASIDVDGANGPSTALPRSLRLAVTAATPTSPAGVQNDGYWGMAVRPSTTYAGSFYAHADKPGTAITISLTSDQTGATAATATVSGIGAEWKQYTYTLKTGASVPASAANHLQLTVTQPGTVWLDLVSLFPPTYHDRPGGNRVDLMDKMAAMHPRFLRLPGGNYLEGDHISERYEWKKTIGPWVDRPTHPSPWHYRSSDGMGLLEFLLWCEDLKIEPVLAVYAGYSMQQEHVEPGPALEPYITDALEEIEYVTGGPETKWGAQRAKDGHPAPFTLHYVEIGNEDWFDKSKSYDGRFTQYYKAFKQRYPQLQLIATAPVTSVKPDVLDEHYYMSAAKSFSDANHYDKVDRNGPKIFVGEWATREGTPTPNLQAALADAAWMTGMERNADLVIMASYAPLFVNVNAGGMQWATDLIGYDAINSYGSPSYYAQVLFGSYLGTEVVPATLAGAGPRVYTSATRDDKTRTLYLKVVNGNSTPAPLAIKLAGAGTVQAGAKLMTLSGASPNATNSLAQPDAVVPVGSTISDAGSQFQHTFPPYSISVLELKY